MPDIDPIIVVHEIPTYLVSKPVRQRLRPVHPRKAAAIKAKVEKLLKAGFIYPIPLTDWVSNIVPVNKKQGTIRVCVDYHDINRAYPKHNFPTPFITQLIDECAGSEMYSLMDSFSGYNQINIALADQHKIAFICPWGTFAYKKLPFSLKNTVLHFNMQCPMLFMTLVTLYNHTWMIFQLIQSNFRIILSIFAIFFFAVDTTVSGSTRTSVSSALNLADFSGSLSPKRAFVWIPLKSRLL